MHKKSVFITRERELILPFVEWLDSQEIKVVAQPLLQYKSVNFEWPFDKMDWIFFSSRNAVKFFFEQEIKIDCKYAAIGPATAKEVAKHVTVSFAGVDYDTQKTAVEFAKLAGDSMILFPCGNNSVRTVQKMLSPAQVMDVVCYEAVRMDSAIGCHDIYVVLSPENARVMLEDLSINRQAVFFVLGELTAEALRGQGISNVHFLPHGDSLDWAKSILT